MTLEKSENTQAAAPGSWWRPVPHREFTGQRWVRIGLRTWHLIAMGLLLGSAAMAPAAPLNAGWLWMTAFSGLAYVLLEVYASGVWLIQLKGLAVVAKFLLLAAAASSSQGGVTLLITAVIIGGISSHMPGRFRYYSPFHGRVVKL